MKQIKDSDIKSDRIDSVDSRGGKRTKMPSTISMSVNHRFANEAQELLMDLKEGKTPTEGLIGLELIAIYAEDQENFVLKENEE